MSSDTADAATAQLTYLTGSPGSAVQAYPIPMAGPSPMIGEAERAGVREAP